LDFFRMVLTAFPDWRMEVEDLIASGDKTVARVGATATHQGEFMGVPPTGQRVEMQLIDIMRFDDAGLVREHWGVADMLSLMQQIGAVPAYRLANACIYALCTQLAVQLVDWALYAVN